MAILGTVQIVTDNFNRANQNPISGNWTDAGGAVFQILSNVVDVVTQSSDSHAIWNTWASGNDQYSQAEITVGSASAGSGLGVCVRANSNVAINTLYRLYIGNDGAWAIDRILTGTVVTIRSGTTTYAAGTALGLLIIGSTLQAYYGGVAIGASIVDANISSGFPGIAYSSTITSRTLDNWDAGIPVLGFRKNPLKPYPFKPGLRR